MAGSSTPGATGRPAQRRRTREAIIDATIGLLGEGRTPTIDDVAAAAEVSRRTIYLHFPTVDQLIVDATMGMLAGAELDAGFAEGSSAADRVEAIVRTLHKHAAEWLPIGRRMVALTAAAPPVDGVKRGHRRVAWIDSALEPLAGQLTQEQHDRLASSLAVLLGWEAMIVLRDIRGLGPRRERTVTSWAARSLVEAMIAEASES